MELYEIVLKLTGPIEPVGETHTDNARLDNLVNFMLLTQEMVQAVKKVSRNASRHEFSMKQAGEFAEKCLKNIQDDISD